MDGFSRDDITVTSHIKERISVGDLEVFLKGLEKDEMRFIWTPTEVEALRQYAPTTYFKLAQELGLPIEEERSTNLALQLQTEIATRPATLDAGIVHGRRNDESTESKLYHLGRLNKMARMMGLEGTTPVPDYKLERGNLDDILIAAKLRFASILQKVPEWGEPVPLETKSANMNDLDTVHEGYLWNVIGACRRVHPTGIVLFGSGAREDDPRNAQDYDLYLIVPDGSLKELYRTLRGKKFKNRIDGKHVGIHVVQEGSFPKLIRFGHDSYEAVHTYQVLYGDASFPVVPEPEIVERGIASAVLRLKSLKSACSWAGRIPSIFNGKEPLWDYFQKTPLFMEQAGLNATEGVATRQKADFIQGMLAVGGSMVPFREGHLDYLRSGIYEASVNATRIFENHFRDREPDLGFITLR